MEALPTIDGAVDEIRSVWIAADGHVAEQRCKGVPELITETGTYLDIP